jgi:4-amino-4-deoxy-L-arabinose transferase-like glycosyltransferase
LALALEARCRQRARLHLAALSGLLVGLAVLTRPANGALVIPVVLLLLLPRPISRRRLASGFAAVVMIALSLAPWQIRNQLAFHRFVPVSTVDAFILAGVYNDQAAHDQVHRALWRAPTFVPGQTELFQDKHLDEATLADALRRRATSYAWHHPGYVPVVVYTNTANLFDLKGFGFAKLANRSLGYGELGTTQWVFSYYVVGLVAIAGAFTKKSRQVPLAFWLTPLLFVLVTVPTLGTSRYRAPIEPFMVLLAALAVSTWAPPTRRRGAVGTR